MRAAVVGTALLAAAAARSASPLAATEADRISAYLKQVHDRGQFSGVALVARQGAVVYWAALGSYAGEAIGPTTRFNIASLSKAFTAMAVMLLHEQQQVDYDRPVAGYLPELPDLPITVRQLLTHTSGIPDVGDLGIDHPGLTEREVLDLVRARRREFAPAGSGFRYSNVNYMLLAMVVEQVSREAFSHFLQTRIFDPLGMQATSLDASVAGAALAKGDGGIVSTVDDLLRWDQAFVAEKLVPAATLAEAFTPGRVNGRPTGYGFGWNIREERDGPYLWHQGSTADFRAFLGRRVGPQVTVILLARGDSPRMEIAEGLFNLLDGRPYRLPKLPISRTLRSALQAGGSDAAVRVYHSLKASDDGTYDFSESQLNTLGYELLAAHDVAAAIRMFQLNATAFPNSSNAFDSLGDAYAANGDRLLAIHAYRHAVELDPHNLGASQHLDGLIAHPH